MKPRMIDEIQQSVDTELWFSILEEIGNTTLSISQIMLLFSRPSSSYGGKMFNVTDKKLWE